MPLWFPWVVPFPAVPHPCVPTTPTDFGHRVDAEQQRLSRLLSAAEFRNLGIAGAGA